MFNFNRLDVYGCSIEFFKLSIPLTERAPVGYHALNDQPRRAEVSPLLLDRTRIGTRVRRHHGRVRSAWRYFAIGGRARKGALGAHRLHAHQAISGQVSVAYVNGTPTPTPTKTPPPRRFIEFHRSQTVRCSSRRSVLRPRRGADSFAHDATPRPGARTRRRPGGSPA